jgi:hypothetical protein
MPLISHTEETLIVPRIEQAIKLILNDTEYTLLQYYAKTVQGEEKDALHAMLSNEHNEMYNQLYGNFWGYFDNDGLSIALHSLLLLGIGFLGMEKDTFEQRNLIILRRMGHSLHALSLLQQQGGEPQNIVDQASLAVKNTALTVRALSRPSKSQRGAQLLFALGLCLPLCYGIIGTYHSVFYAEQVKKKERIHDILLNLQKT